MAVLVIAEKLSGAWKAMAVNEKGGTDPKLIENIVKQIDEVWGEERI